MITVGEFIKRLSFTELTPNQKTLLSLLYNAKDGLTVRVLAEVMFEDGHSHRLAGVLADLSKRLVPGVEDNAYQLYFDTDHAPLPEERLWLKPELRRAIDMMVNKPF